jgi:hypothetical protein
MGEVKPEGMVAGSDMGGPLVPARRSVANLLLESANCDSSRGFRAAPPSMPPGCRGLPAVTTFQTRCAPLSGVKLLQRDFR